MLTHITTDQIRHIIYLSDVAADMADRLTNRLVRSDAGRESAGGQQVHRGGELPGELSDLEPLEASTMADAVRNLERAIADLTPGGRQELHAVYLIGRGEFTSREWEEATEAAAARANESEPAMLAERQNLGPHLSKGLYLLKLS